VVAVLVTTGLLIVAVMFGVAGVVRGSTPSPTPSPSGPAPVTTVVGADDAWHGTAVRLVFVAEDRGGTGIAATEFSVDGGAWRTGTSVVIPAPKDHSWDGRHAVSYRSRDNAGVVEEAQSCVVRIDTTAPRIKWVSCKPALRTRPGPQRARVRVTEATGTSTIQLVVVDALGRKVVTVRPKTVRNGTRTLTWNGRNARGRAVAPGRYGIRLVVRDALGNRRVTGIKWFRDQHPVASRAVRAGRSAGRMVALTFDDGASASAWAQLLNVLRSHKVKASFFPVGTEVLAKAGLARRTVREGHTIGNHTWNHPTMSRLGHGAAISQLRRTEAAWWRVARTTPAPFFRPPYGDMSAGTVVAAGAAGYRYTVLWDVDPYDWRNPGVGVIASRVLSSVRPGSIVVMHISGQTAQALPAIIRGLKARGLKPVSLHEMFAAGLR
jgi:peptidoglycan/xylan/chitin deacetylase (PgdA/CDA1 family)